MQDYEGNMKFFQDQLAKKGITKEMFDVENYIGLTFNELQELVDSISPAEGSYGNEC